MKNITINLNQEIINDLSLLELKTLSTIVKNSLAEIETKKSDENLDFDLLKEYYNSVFTKSLRIVSEKTKINLRKRIKEGHSKADIRKVIDNASNDKFHEPNNFKHVTLEFLSRADIFSRYVSEIEHQIPRNKKLLKQRLEQGHTNH